MEFTRNEAVAFTGHRNVQFSNEIVLRKCIAATIETVYKNGKKVFITGMAMGFDLIAAEEVLKARKIHDDIRLIGAIPYPEQPVKFSIGWKKRYTDVKEKLDDTVIMSRAYHDRCYQERNVWMISHCSLLIALYDGRKVSGTQFTVNRANKVGVQIINLNDYVNG